MDKSIFRAYDVRGLYPRQINENTVQKITETLAGFFKKGEIIVAHDARISSSKLYRKVLLGLETNKKIKAVEIGFATTPLFYFAVNRLKASGGIMVTASHNPKEWNGLKVVGKRAVMIPGKKILKILEKENDQ